MEKPNLPFSDYHPNKLQINMLKKRYEGLKTRLAENLVSKQEYDDEVAWIKTKLDEYKLCKTWEVDRKYRGLRGLTNISRTGIIRV